MIPCKDLPARAGIGLKPQHYRDVLASVDGGPTPAWVEIHPQNYAGAGGPPHRWLGAIAERFPMSFHSVSLSLGHAAGYDEAELDRIIALSARYHPAMISDHLSWSGGPSNRYPDLLPVPYTDAVLDHIVTQVERVQDRLGRSMLIENPSRALTFAGGEMDEACFINHLCVRTGCGVLLDLNNIEVSATNLGDDPVTAMDAIDPRHVREIHLAGHSREERLDGPLLIDDHGSPVSDLTWRLFRRFIETNGPRPTLIEWDTDVPDFATLMAEAAKADAILAAQTTGQCVEQAHAYA